MHSLGCCTAEANAQPDLCPWATLVERKALQGLAHTQEIADNFVIRGLCREEFFSNGAVGCGDTSSKLGCNDEWTASQGLLIIIAFIHVKFRTSFELFRGYLCLYNVNNERYFQFMRAFEFFVIGAEIS